MGNLPDDPEEHPIGGYSLRTLVLGSASILLVVAAGLIWWASRADDDTATCTSAGAVGTPAADSAEAAFDAWFADQGPDASLRRVSSTGIAPPTRDDYARVNSTSWEWRHQEHASVLVETRERDDGQWAVSGVNACTYS